MIEFTCSVCGKSYSFSERFAGRKMVCVDCKNDLVVPESSTTQPTTLPTSVSSSSTPPPIITASISDPESLSLPSEIEPAQNDDAKFAATSDTSDAIDTALLAAVFTDKIQDKREEIARKKIPPSLPKTKEIEITPKKKIISVELLLVGLLVFVFLGVAIYFIFIFDWLGVDARVELLKQLEDRRINTTIAIGKKESEAESLRVRSFGSWASTCDAIDSFIMTMGDIDVKNRDVLELDWNIALDTINESGKQQLAEVRDTIKYSIPAAEANLSKLKLQVKEDAAKAEADELATDVATRDVINLREEESFYAAEITKLQQRISDLPKERPNVSFPVFDKEKLPPREDTVRLSKDWTEEYYNQFTFLTTNEGNCFTTFDGMRRLFGNRSLRVTLFAREPITIQFPNNYRTKNELKISRTFNMAMRFPDLTDAIMVGEERDTGQFSEIRIRFINAAGHIDFKTKSREYCDAIFYSGRGKFIAIEFSLEGDEFWIRSDNFDKTKLPKIADQKNEHVLTEEEIKAMINESKALEREREAEVLSFFNHVDRVEFRLIPVSKRTTFWIDGIAVSDNFAQTKIDLVRANSLRRELQKLEQENRQKRRQRSAFNSLSQIKGFQAWQQPEQPEIDPNSLDSINEQNINYAQNNTTPTTQTKPTTKPNNDNKTTNKPEETIDLNVLDKSKSAFFKWVLNDANGRIKASYRGRVFTFNRNAKLPDEFEDYEIVQVSISDYKITEQQLDWIVSFDKIKRLDLSNVGLRDSDVLKLSVLTLLEALNLANNKLTYESLPALKVLVNLRELDLSKIATSVNGIDSLGAFRSLVSLNLSNSVFDSTDLNYCITLTNLEVLNLSGTKVGDRVTGIMQMLGKLREVNLSRTRISNKAIDSLIEHEGIEVLWLDGLELDDGCLDSLGKIKNLKSVSAQKTKITNNGIKQKLNNTKINFKL
jgi:hypothetical protein